MTKHGTKDQLWVSGSNNIKSINNTIAQNYT